MAGDRRRSWGEGELYELLCLLLTGTCTWFVGASCGVFAWAGDRLLRSGLQDFAMLAIVMGFATTVAVVRKSLMLRQIMTERDQATAQAEAFARHDVLTGLANRRLFVEAIDKRLYGAKRSAVLLIDLDRFKPVNDLYGHAAGNAVLCAVAERMTNLLGGRGVAARLGGDEFAMVVDLSASSDDLVHLVQSLINSIGQPIVWNETELKIGATIGIAFVLSDHADADAVLHAADLAMYQGKKDGRGSFRFYRNVMDLELKARAQLEQELRQAIAEDRIEPFYQPVVTLPDRVMTGVEVLARWRHPERGLLSPSMFIPVAEETNLIGELTFQLLRRACREARGWPTHLTLAINIAPQLFQDQWLSEHILTILIETGFPPGRLEIEITETALVQDLDATRSTLSSLRNLGVRIALDDFGTGYSSLYHLRELQFDKLKIDRSYVDAITMSDERAKLVDAIIKLGSSLGLVTTAEGIETDASLNWLAGQGCDYGQGFLFGAPMPKNQMDMLVQDLHSDPSKSGFEKDFSSSRPEEGSVTNSAPAAA